MTDAGEKDEAYVLPEDCTLNPDGTVTMPLRFPIVLTIKGNGGDMEDRVETVTIRRSTLDDNLKVAPNKEVSRIGMKEMLEIERQRIQMLTGLSSPAVGKLDDVDVERIQGVIAGFTLPGQLDGSRPQA